MEPVAHPSGHAKSCDQRSRWNHDCILCAGPWIFHSSQELAVQRVHIEANRRSPALALGVELVVSAFGVDVDEVDLTSHYPALSFEPAYVGRYYSFLATAHDRTVRNSRRDEPVGGMTGCLVLVSLASLCSPHLTIAIDARVRTASICSGSSVGAFPCHAGRSSDEVTRQARRKSCLDSPAQRCRLTHLVIGTSTDASSRLSCP